MKWGKPCDQNEKLGRKIEVIKKPNRNSGAENTMKEITSALESMNSRIIQVEKRIFELKIRFFKIYRQRINKQINK